jgi:hypothetical protein
MGGACSTNGGEEKMHIGYWWESQKERDHWENGDVGGWVGNIKMDHREIGWDGVEWIGLDRYGSG